MKGYSIKPRIDPLEKKVAEHDNKTDFLIKASKKDLSNKRFAFSKPDAGLILELLKRLNQE